MTSCRKISILLILMLVFTISSCTKEEKYESIDEVPEDVLVIIRYGDLFEQTIFSNLSKDQAAKLLNDITTEMLLIKDKSKYQENPQGLLNYVLQEKNTSVAKDIKEMQISNKQIEAMKERIDVSFTENKKQYTKNGVTNLDVSPDDYPQDVKKALENGEYIK
ncbi:hypothetical protein [Clostridiisalibacter paucivorans]|uniref:hypothetical protein n=1 Tax=Clostridiisalibacter paucivorans TaxID=408753 RepID=UPI0004797E4E|nr:hypothetical protein [Clostridiisalibacter paucivorans]